MSSSVSNVVKTTSAASTTLLPSTFGMSLQLSFYTPIWGASSR